MPWKNSQISVDPNQALLTQTCSDTPPCAMLKWNGIDGALLHPTIRSPSWMAFLKKRLLAHMGLSVTGLKKRQTSRFPLQKNEFNMILTIKNCRFEQPKIRSSLTNTASIMTSITLCFPRPAGPCSSCSPSGFAGASFGFLRRQNHGIAWEKVLGRRIHPEKMVGKEYLRIVWRKNEHHREKIEKMFGNSMEWRRSVCWETWNLMGRNN